MTTVYRCCHCHNSLTKDELMYYEYSCERCEHKFERRVVHSHYSAQPSKFAQRIAILLAIALIAACVMVMKHFGGAK